MNERPSFTEGVRARTAAALAHIRAVGHSQTPKGTEHTPTTRRTLSGKVLPRDHETPAFHPAPLPGRGKAGPTAANQRALAVLGTRAAHPSYVVVPYFAVPQPTSSARRRERRPALVAAAKAERRQRREVVATQ